MWQKKDYRKKPIFIANYLPLMAVQISVNDDCSNLTKHRFFKTSFLEVIYGVNIYQVVNSLAQGKSRLFHWGLTCFLFCICQFSSRQIVLMYLYYGQNLQFFSYRLIKLDRNDKGVYVNCKFRKLLLYLYDSYLTTLIIFISVMIIN